ncbi:MAG: DEAD/DEAH box helicase [Thermoanaerobaculia bacterium]
MEDPIGGFERIRELYLNYLDTAFRIRNEPVAEERRQLLRQPGQFCADPFIEPLPRYESAGFGIDDLINDEDNDHRLPGFSKAERANFANIVLRGLFDSDVDAGGERRAKNQLFTHQAQALRRGVSAGSPVIVTSGTGSGKTESFLLPIFASIIREGTAEWKKPEPEYLRHFWWQSADGSPYDMYGDLPNRPTSRRPQSTPFISHRAGERRPAAVRALILYPMNALVEDQLVRLRRAIDSDGVRVAMDSALQGNRIFMGRYTSATPVTGFHFHPRPDADEHKRRKKLLERLFYRIKQAYADHRGACDPSIDSDARYLFPSLDGAELFSRWDMQLTPPDLLITNVSMLSAMLSRDVDAPIFERTREWLDSSETSYFFLVLDELHLHRGSAGAEVSYLLRTLIHRLGLDSPGSRSKLRIISSSASLPLEGARGERTLSYLWDMFGSLGWGGKPHAKDLWKSAVIPGTLLPESNPTNHTLDPAVQIALLRASVSAGDLVHHRQIDQLENEWRAVARDVVRRDDGDLTELVRSIVMTLSARLTAACWVPSEQRSRATALTKVAEALFGQHPLALEGVRASLFLRSIGDSLPQAGNFSPNRFRIHTFFRSIDGLFAPVASASDDRCVGTLSVERGLKLDPSHSGHRMLEVLYCECCGDLLFGGMRGERQGGDVELLPHDPLLDGLPDTATNQLFESLSYVDYAIFWPGLEAPRVVPAIGEWRPAHLDPRTGQVRVQRRLSTSTSQGLRGYLYYRDSNRRDDHGRSGRSQGSAVPYECPACDTDYSPRPLSMRLSPLRNFRAGFAKTTQLLATELFELQTLHTTNAKLVSFSDSRQDAAKASLDIQRRHHEDFRRQVLVRTLREHLERRRSAANIEDDMRRTLRSVSEAASAGAVDELLILQRRIESLRGEQLESTASGVALGQIIESDSPTFYGVLPKRDTLKPYLASFVQRGVHPADPAGVQTVRIGNDEVPWTDLFTTNGDVVDWRDVPANVPHVDSARRALVNGTYQLLSEVIFNKTYFSLEETGLGYPAVARGSLSQVEYDELNSYLRVFADAYRVRDNEWGNFAKPWTHAAEIGARNRVRLFARAANPTKDPDDILNGVLARLGIAGHPQGKIITPNICIELTDEDSLVWRCSRCGRAHLHRGVGICTRCREKLDVTPSGTAMQLRRRNFLATKTDRASSIFRLHSEELTGQTDDPAERQRKFKNIVVDRIGDELWRRKEIVDVLAVTTTMEVGIDIGPLQAILQANMPPQRFNYQQRVGRAGRRGQAFSMVLTICRSKSHDLHYFRFPEQITGDEPPPPFLSKRMPNAAQRFVRKLWLAAAFSIVKRDCEARGDDYPGDRATPDVHGEYIPAELYFDQSLRWQSDVRAALDSTVAYRDGVAALLAEDSNLPVEDILKGLSTDELIEDIEGVRRRVSRVREEGLANTLAEAGLMPMFGMPTRIRNLYTGYKDKPPKRHEWVTMDRDLEYAIFEFAPGSTVVMDKKQLRGIGFTGALGEFRYGVRRYRVDVPVLSEPFAPAFWLVECENCGSTIRRNDTPGDERCECGWSLSSENATECRVPNGFRTDFRQDSVEADEVASARHRTVTAEALSPNLIDSPQASLRTAFHPQTTTYRLNKGERDEASTAPATVWKGFSVDYGTHHLQSYTDIPDQALAEQIRSFTTDGRSIREFWLAAPKTTDSLYIAPDVRTRAGLTLHTVGGNIVRNRDTAVRAAALSASYILAYKSAFALDIDPDEFDVLEPRVYRDVNDQIIPLLQISDHLVNGAGFCEELSRMTSDNEPMIVSLIRETLDGPQKYPQSAWMSPEHRESCDQSCYLCLQRYGNRPFHGLLDWRLGLAYLRCLLDHEFKSGLTGDFEFPELLDWKSWARRYAVEMVERFGNSGRVAEIEGLPAFTFDDSGNWAVIVHPLWDRITPSGLLQEAIEKFDGLNLQLVTSFDLARRQVRVRETLMAQWS